MSSGLLECVCVCVCIHYSTGRGGVGSGGGSVESKAQRQIEKGISDLVFPQNCQCHCHCCRNVRVGASLMLRPPEEATTLDEMQRVMDMAAAGIGGGGGGGGGGRR